MHELGPAIFPFIHFAPYSMIKSLYRLGEQDRTTRCSTHREVLFLQLLLSFTDAKLTERFEPFSPYTLPSFIFTCPCRSIIQVTAQNREMCHQNNVGDQSWTWYRMGKHDAGEFQAPNNKVDPDVRSILPRSNCYRQNCPLQQAHRE